ncbi:coiled-coil domain-containing protein 94 [Cephus cinctus]|uniref:Splicing factor YJU2 n=1 Tax=Cephus cinctus TaxID=211228 RepID=A0AAJ7FKY4_CEPCN|nr:coiled-coil domain-containing protein 94 [Cephus cinctus]
MSERKVLNKYYPPDFDPSKIPRMKFARNRQYTVRLMAPFNMRCKTCGEYIYKGKKFNARKEDVEGDDYLGIRIYRFYIKCTRCLQEISFKTDPKNTDYEIEAGATRNFMALKLAEEQAQREEDEEKEEEATNPMKLLEKRTQQSKQELELLESLEELKDLNRRQQTIDYDQMLEQFDTEAATRRTEKEQEELDEQYVRSVFGQKQGTSGVVVEEEIIELKDESNEPPRKVMKTDDKKVKEKDESSVEEVNEAPNNDNKTQLQSTSVSSIVGGSTWSSNSGITSSKSNLSGLVKKKSNLGVKLYSGIKKIDQSINLKTESSYSENLEKPKTENDKKSAIPKIDETVEPKKIVENTQISTVNGLSLLGAYSGSSDNDSD